jgi:hypothetical protein
MIKQFKNGIIKATGKDANNIIRKLQGGDKEFKQLSAEENNYATGETVDITGTFTELAIFNGTVPKGDNLERLIID